MKKLFMPVCLFLFGAAISLAIMPVAFVPCLLGGILYLITHRRAEAGVLTDNRRIRSEKCWAMILIISPIPIIAAVVILLGGTLFMAG